MIEFHSQVTQAVPDYRRTPTRIQIIRYKRRQVRIQVCTTIRWMKRRWVWNSKWWENSYIGKATDQHFAYKLLAVSQMWSRNAFHFAWRINELKGWLDWGVAFWFGHTTSFWLWNGIMFLVSSYKLNLFCLAFGHRRMYNKHYSLKFEVCRDVIQSDGKSEYRGMRNVACTYPSTVMFANVW